MERKNEAGLVDIGLVKRAMEAGRKEERLRWLAWLEKWVKKNKCGEDKIDWGLEMVVAEDLLSAAKKEGVQPLAGGRCCSKCNSAKVLPARLK